MGVAEAEVLSAGPRRSTIEFVTPDRVTYRPELGVLYPSELDTGMRIYVEYDKHNPDLVRVQHRNAALAIIPAGSIAVVGWLVAGAALTGLAVPRQAAGPSGWTRSSSQSSIVSVDLLLVFEVVNRWGSWVIRARLRRDVPVVGLVDRRRRRPRCRRRDLVGDQSGIPAFAGHRRDVVVAWAVGTPDGGPEVLDEALERRRPTRRSGSGGQEQRVGDPRRIRRCDACRRGMSAGGR